MTDLKKKKNRLLTLRKKQTKWQLSSYRECEVGACFSNRKSMKVCGLLEHKGEKNNQK